MQSFLLRKVSLLHPIVEYPTSDRRLLFSTRVDQEYSVSRVHDILDCPVGSLGVNLGWQNVESTIREAIRGRDNAEVLFGLLDRLVQELDHGPEGTTDITGQDLYPLLNSMAYQWRYAYVRASDKSSTFLQPSEFARKIHVWGRQCSLRGDTSVYTMILEAASSNTKDTKQGIEYANGLLEWMIEEARERQNFGVQPSIYSVGTVLEGWVASKHPNACERIEGWLQRVQRLHNEGWLDLKPNTVVYNIFLHALAEAKNTERAEQVLQSLLAGRDGVDPDPVSFSTVLLAYTKQQTTEAMANAETLLNQMQELFQSGMESAKPTLVAFTTVIHGFAQLGQPQPAEKLLNKLLELYGETLDADLEPDVTVYNSVMTAWSNAGQPDRADNYLRGILDSGSVEPNDRSFNAVLRGWANVGKPDEAESLLFRMHGSHAEQIHSHPPTTMSYNIVLDAWAKSKRPDSWERALDILKYMEDLYQDGNIDLRPNSVTWNTVLNCIRYAGQGNFHLAFKVLDRFKAAFAAGRVDKGPNLITWNTLLAGCVGNTKDDHRVQQVWDMMSKDNCKPDITTYDTIFACFANYKAGKETTKSLKWFIKRMQADSLMPSKMTYLRLVEAWIALERIDEAERILDQLCNEASSRGNNVAIDRNQFHRVFLAWSRLKKARRIESSLPVMHNLNEKYGLEAVGPSLETYNILLQSWANSGERQSGERAEFLLRQMANRGVHPSRVSYNIVLNAWAQSGDLVACSKIEILVLEMILCGNRELYPDETSYNTWMKAIVNDVDVRNKTRRMKGLLDTMRIHNFEPSDFIRKEIVALAGMEPTATNLV